MLAQRTGKAEEEILKEAVLTEKVRVSDSAPFYRLTRSTCRSFPMARVLVAPDGVLSRRSSAASLRDGLCSFLWQQRRQVSMAHVSTHMHTLQRVVCSSGSCGLITGQL